MTKEKKLSLKTKVDLQGSAFLESLLSHDCILHKVTREKDIGLDYFGEWLKGLTSSRVLFGVQLKTVTEKHIEIIKGKRSGLNLLPECKLKTYGKTTHQFLTQRDIQYLSGFEIPVFLFIIILKKNGGFDCYYKRVTPILHKENPLAKDLNKESFYPAKGPSNRFLSFFNRKKRIGGFCRDLFIDLIRCYYNIGALAYKNPRDLGLKQFPDKKTSVIFLKMAKEKKYLSRLKKNYRTFKEFGIIQKLSPSTHLPKYSASMPPSIQVEPSPAIPEFEDE